MVKTQPKREPSEEPLEKEVASPAKTFAYIDFQEEMVVGKANVSNAKEVANNEMQFNPKAPTGEVKELREKLKEKMAPSDSLFGNQVSPEAEDLIHQESTSISPKPSSTHGFAPDESKDDFPFLTHSTLPQPSAELDSQEKIATFTEPQDELIGKVIANKFELVALLGVGAMGKVYKAIQRPINRICAIKVLHKNLIDEARREMLEKRFHREATAASAINHENSIQIYDFGQTEDHLLYLAMEFINGKDLAEIIEITGPLPLERVRKIACQTLDALQAAHLSRIAHRDLKPENIMLHSTHNKADIVKVCDFGIAKVLPEEDGRNQTKLTQFGMVCGTPYYMSPEQARAQELDARTDLYSMGVILFEMLTGEVPFFGTTPVEVIAKHLTEAAPSISKRFPQIGIHPAIEKVVMKAMEKNREHRFTSAQEFKDALEEAFSISVSDSSTTLRSMGEQKAKLSTSSSDILPVSTARVHSLLNEPSMKQSYVDASLDDFHSQKKRPIWMLLTLILLFSGVLLVGAWAIVNKLSNQQNKSDKNKPLQPLDVKPLDPTIASKNTTLPKKEIIPSQKTTDTSVKEKVVIQKVEQIVSTKKHKAKRKKRRHKKKIARKTKKKAIVVKKEPIVAVLPPKKEEPKVDPALLTFEKSKKIFKRWKSSQGFQNSDLGSISSLYTKALEYAGNRDYFNASKQLQLLLAQTQKRATLDEKFTDKKFNRLKALLAKVKKQKPKQVKQVEDTLFQPIVEAYMGQQTNKMNRLLNKAFRLLR